jgi:F0F1-type ATP synthase epsilon subunit
VTVLADDAIPVSAVSRAAAEQRLTAAEAEYAAADRMDVPALDAAMGKIQSARAMMQAAGAP